MGATCTRSSPMTRDMPTVTRRRRVGAPLDEVWRVVSDPERLPAWWPGVTRVEEASPEAWTTVLTSSRGKAVRADFTRVESEPPRRLAWRQEVEESPFERILSESLTSLELTPEDGDSTTVELTVRHRPRGFARFGFLQLRLAAQRQVEGALEGLGSIMEA
jgi:uncharacterized protein YndB with AHSA1/START domain